MENVVLFPHLGSASVYTRTQMDQLVVDNLKAWAAGKRAADAGAGDAVAADAVHDAGPHDGPCPAVLAWRWPVKQAFGEFMVRCVALLAALILMAFCPARRAPKAPSARPRRRWSAAGKFPMPTATAAVR